MSGFILIELQPGMLLLSNRKDSKACIIEIGHSQNGILVRNRHSVELRCSSLDMPPRFTVRFGKARTRKACGSQKAAVDLVCRYHLCRQCIHIASPSEY